MKRASANHFHRLLRCNTHDVLVRVITCVCLILVLVGCGTRSQSLNFRTLDEGFALNYFERRFEPYLYAMKSQEDVEYVSVELTQELRPGDSSPQQEQMIEQLRHVDFSSHIALLVLQGPVGGTGGIDVTKVTLEDDLVRVYANFTTPKRGEAIPAIASDPYKLILVDKNNIDDPNTDVSYPAQAERSDDATGYEVPVRPVQPQQRNPWDDPLRFELIVNNDVVAIYRLR